MSGRAPFIPIWLDDAGLSAVQFRVLCHLWRRADRSGRCYPGAESIREACNISDDALWPALKKLEERGFLIREKARYNSNRYTLRLPDVTPQNRVTVLPTKTGEQLPGNGGELAPTKTGEQLPGFDGCKGITNEGTPDEGTPKKEEVSSVLALPNVLATDVFKLKWAEYIEYRRTSGMKALKPVSISKKWEELVAWGHDAAIRAIDDTIRNGWQGIFEPKAAARVSHRRVSEYDRSF